jgi:hypothetical protein
VQGTVVLDESTGLVLRVNVTGQYQIGEGKEKVVATLTLQGHYQPNQETSLLPPKKVVLVEHEVDAHDPFARKKPAFLQPPPSDEDGKGTTAPKQRKRKQTQVP